MLVFCCCICLVCCLYDVYSFRYAAVLLLVCWCFVVYMMCTLFGMYPFVVVVSVVLGWVMASVVCMSWCYVRCLRLVG